MRGARPPRGGPTAAWAQAGLWLFLGGLAPLAAAPPAPGPPPGEAQRQAGKGRGVAGPGRAAAQKDTYGNPVNVGQGEVGVRAWEGEGLVCGNLRFSRCLRSYRAVPEEAAAHNISTSEALARLCRLLVPEGQRKEVLRALEGQEVQRRIGWSEKAFAALRVADDDLEGQICFALAFFREVPAAYIIATDENVDAFMRACRDVFQDSDPEALWRLRRAAGDGSLRFKLDEEVWRDPWTPVERGSACAGPDAGEPGDARDAGSGPDAAAYLEAGLRPLPEPTVGAGGVAAAFAAGQVARLDAAGLLPRSLLNITIREISWLQGAEAEKIPVHFGLHHGGGEVPLCGEPLKTLTNEYRHWPPQSELAQASLRALVPWLMATQCRPPVTLGQLARMSEGFVDEEMEFTHLRAQEPAVLEKARRLVAAGQLVRAGEINLRRLPGLAHLAPRWAAMLGIEAEVEHVHSFLWLGVTEGQWHVDPYDNMLIQLRGRVDVLVFPPNCSFLLCPKIHEDAGLIKWATNSMPFGTPRAPFFHLELGPGQGVVIPSGAKHRVVNRDVHRVGINAFFEPKFGRMGWNRAANMFARGDRDVLAARSVWVRTVRRLWDTRRISMFYHTARMEII